MAAIAMKARSGIQRCRRRFRSALSVGLLAVSVQPTQAAVFTVDSVIDARDALAGDGICLTTGGACTLRAAIEESNALPGADSISVPAGTYLIMLGSGDDNAERGDFDVLDVLTINGAGRGLTIIDGNNVDRVFDVRQNSSLRISAVTISNGNVNGHGGGIRSEAALTAIDVLVVNNAGHDGGGISVRRNGSTATLTNVDFFNNSGDEGGGLHVKNDSTVSLSDSTFRGNSANKDGGGAYLQDGVFDLADVTFENNSAKEGGGLLAKDVLTASIFNSSFSDNSATKEGGGLHFDKSIANIERSLVSGNSADDGGGLFVKGGSSIVDIENVTISNNVASGEGGGIQKESNGVISLLNVTVNGNDAPRGGGLRHKDGRLTVTNSIVANSTQGGDCDGDVTSLGNNIDSDSTCLLGQPGDLAGTDPLLGPLQDNGGPTLTHALADFSPARDAGEASVCPVVDQRGQARPVDGNADGIAVCDIGAYEAEPLYPDFNVVKSVTTLSDPISGSSNPKALPSAVMQYTISLSNAGPGAADQDSMVITEALPSDTSLVVADFDTANPGPVAFVDGVPPSGFSYAFDSLDSMTDDIEFSDDGGADFSYVPTPGADGSDPNVTHMRILPKGLAPFSGADPVVAFLFKVSVR